MSGTGPVFTLSPRDYDAVLFDLDGVLTRTASVHAADPSTCWTRICRQSWLAYSVANNVMPPTDSRVAGR